MDRKSWLRIIARSEAAQLVRLWQSCQIEVQQRWLREPETGLLPMQARMGNSGSAFLFGDATVTRAVVQAEGKTGYAFVLGRDKNQARCAALLDALMQTDDYRDVLIEHVFIPLRDACNQRDSEQEKAVSATKVDFFTLVRGE